MNYNLRNSEIIKTDEENTNSILNEYHSKEQTENKKNSNSEECIDSKDWRIRKNIYSNIISKLQIQSISEILNSHIISNPEEKLINYLPKILEDNLPQSLEIGLDVIIEILKKDEQENYIINEEIKNDIFKNTLEKAILSTKTPCKEKAKEITFLLFELNAHLIGSFMKYIAKVFESNKPKVIKNSIFSLTT